MILKLIVLGVGALVALIVYGYVIKTYLGIYAQAIGKDSLVASSSGLDKVWAILNGWRAVICTWIAAGFGLVTAIPAETLQAWSTLPWAGVVDQHIASGIAIAFSLMAGIFHVQTAASAANTTPQN